MIWLAAIFGFAFPYGRPRHRDTRHTTKQDGGGDYYCDDGGNTNYGDCE